MCRQYEYYFPNECQHTCRSPAWFFPCSNHTTCLSLTIHGLTSPHHCPNCLSQYWHPAKASSSVTLPLDRVRKAESVFQRAKTHHRDHPTGEFHFDQWDIEAFRKFQVRISPVDREWLQEMEEDMNCLIWKQARNPQAEPPTFADRMLVLQIRDAHHHARILELEEEKRESDRLVEAAARVQARNIARIQGLLTAISVDDSVACDICCEPFNSSEIGAEQGEIAVRLPCGHLFGQTCIEAWLQLFNRDCPFCRRSFGLLESEDADVAAEAQIILAYAQTGYLTTFWIEMLRGS